MVLDAQSVETLALETVSAADRPALVQCWIALKGAPPPKGLSTRLLRMAVAYAVQEKVGGGLDAKTAKALARCAAQPAGHPKTDRKTRRPSRSGLRPGVRLVRVWGGRTHVVDVAEDGFLWRGETWRSLSVIAREITGVRWSGPRFFGLDRKRSRKAHG